MNFLLNMTIVTTITSIGILLIKVIFKNRMSAFLHYYIWVIFLARVLLIPIIPDGGSGILNFTTQKENIAEVSSLADTSLKEDSSEIKDKIETPKIQYKIRESIKNNIIVIWLFGGGILLLYYLCVYIHFSIKIRKIPSYYDKEILVILNECREMVGIRKNVSLKIHNISPMLKGIFLPVILLNNVYDNNELKQVLIHELCHAKHNDTAINFFALIFLCINWYNPIIWISFFTFQKDTEMLCDQKVINITQNKKEYAILLMNTAVRDNKSLLATISIKRGKKEIKRRILFMANFKKPTIVYKGMMSFAVILICIVCLITPKVNAASVSTNSNSINEMQLSDTNFTNEIKISEQNEELVSSFINSISYDKDSKILKFIIPKTIPDGFKWLVHIDGHELMNENEKVIFHAFEDESYNFTWEKGKIYTQEFKENPMISCSIRIGLIDTNSPHDIQNEMVVNINKEGAIRKTSAVTYDAVNRLLGTINYDKSTKNISFTIPETTPDKFKWFIHVDGHELMGENNPVVFHAFEDESYNFKWEKGKTYTHEFKGNLMTSCSIMVGLINDNLPHDIQNQVIVRINSDGEITYSYPETNTSV